MSKNKVVLIIQARQSSTRFPEKITQQVGEYTVLEWLLKAGREMSVLDEIVLAVPEDEPTKFFDDIGRRWNVPVSKGSRDNVLARFCSAAEMSQADHVVRITSDCPFFDPRIGEHLISSYLQAEADYACNNEPFTFPHGYDCEVMRSGMLFLAREHAHDSFDQEHVTPWIKRDARVKRIYFEDADRHRRHWRLTIDYPEDLAFLCAVHAELGSKFQSYDHLRGLLDSAPELLALNAMRRQR